MEPTTSRDSSQLFPTTVRAWLSVKPRARCLSPELRSTSQRGSILRFYRIHKPHTACAFCHNNGLWGLVRKTLRPSTKDKLGVLKSQIQDSEWCVPTGKFRLRSEFSGPASPEHRAIRDQDGVLYSSPSVPNSWPSIESPEDTYISLCPQSAKQADQHR